MLPCDVVFGEREAVFFIPPSLVEPIATAFETSEARYQWIKKKFDERQYRPSEIYSRPNDPALVKEMED